MKNRTILLLLLLLPSVGELIAQPDGTAARNEMKVFSDWPGIWKGEGSMQMGEAIKKSKVEEKIQWKLDEMVMMFEGTGKNDEGKIVHNAMGFLSYDGASKQFKMKSYLADGRSTDAWFTILSENHYQWGFDVNPGKIKYSITVNLQAKTWNEVGEYSRDGTEYKKFFEMNLTKQ